MQLNWSEILEYVLKFTLVSLLGGISAYILSFIKIKKQELLEKIKDSLTKKYLDMLEITISDCVSATNQTFVDTLKTNGMFDAEAQKQAFKQTFSSVKELLTDDAQKYLSEAVKDLDAYITSKIEAHVKVQHNL